MLNINNWNKKYFVHLIFYQVTEEGPLLKMKTLSIQQKVYGAIAILSLLVVIAGAVIDHYSTKIAEEAVVMDALARQRMLTQAMGKAALSNVSVSEYETAKNIFTQTLQAAKVGGEFPADLEMTKMASMQAIDWPDPIIYTRFRIQFS